METKGAVHSDLAIPPGEYLEEVVEELGMTKEELARRMGRPATKLSPIFKGEKAITPDTALQLEKVVGVPAHIWTGLEAEYRLVLAKREEELKEQQLIEEAGLVTKYPYGNLVTAGEVEDHAKRPEKAKELRKFFGVTSLKIVPRIERYNPSFRVGRSARGERTPEAIAAWLRMGERRGQAVRCAPFDANRLRGILPELRAMTLQSLEEFQGPMRQKLADCGVALVVCPHFAKTKAHGATFWLGKDKAVLMITIRFKWADIFWFSLFHEIGHILLHGNKAVILEDGEKDEPEHQADQFAADMLIPPIEYRRLIQGGTIQLGQIRPFANRIGIHPGIVAGRLQFEKRLRRDWGNKLRVRYEWDKSRCW
jgi:HTH-type transcriptional regulator / antitoxin HigA